jgi:hypothetical protein
MLFKIESLKPEKILDDIFATLDMLIEKYVYITKLVEKLSG